MRAASAKKTAVLPGRFKRLIFTPRQDLTSRYYKYVGRWSVGKALAGLIPAGFSPLGVRQVRRHKGGLIPRVTVAAPLRGLDFDDLAIEGISSRVISGSPRGRHGAVARVIR